MVADAALPAPGAIAVGRLFDPVVDGPCVVAVRGDRLVGLTDHAATMSDLLERPDCVAVARTAGTQDAADGNATGMQGTPRSWAYAEVLAATLDRRTDEPHLLAPVDLQVVKAAGVTFVRSMLERVVEEAAGGDPQRAAELRRRFEEAVGGQLQDVVPGSQAAYRLRTTLQEQGLWSQYLEVGIGPDPEIFTKAPVLAAVGTGAEVGVLARSTWNNPEPEVVLVATSAGEAVGVTLGNDVNLRDFEGRSALLLTEAKDNNASCAIGPLIRLLDDDFTMDDVRQLELTVEVRGEDGFELRETSSMSEISRDPAALLEHACGPHHQYPDGFVLFTGTMFAPVQDRDAVGEGFTHHAGDRVTISCPALGTLVNTVTAAEQAPPWTFGLRALMTNLAARGVLAPGAERVGGDMTATNPGPGRPGPTRRWPSGLDHPATASERRFPDGGAFRVEIPTVEGPAALEAVLGAAAELDVRVHRVSQGSGVAMLSDAEITDMVQQATAADVELCLFLGPRGTWDVGAAVRSPGASLGPRVRGGDQLRYSLDDAARAAELGVRCLLVADEGVLWAVHLARVAGDLPADLRIKLSALTGPANPAAFQVVQSLGADSVNVPGDLTVHQLAELRAVGAAAIDLYVESPDGAGGFVRHHEAPEFVRVGAPIYLKFGLRNAPDIYPTGAHLQELAKSTGRERVNRAHLGLALLERTGLLDQMSPAGAREIGPLERFGEPR